MTWQFVFVVVAASLVVACGPASPEPAASFAAVSPSATDPGNAGGNKSLTVMTRNLYLGAELTGVFGKGGLDFLLATTDVWAMVQKNDFPVRAQAIADEIAAAQPDVVGLQEVYTWRIQVPGDFLAGNLMPNAETVVYDYLEILQAALASRGLAYRVAATVELSDLEAPILIGPPTEQGIPTADVRMTDHEVILVRADAETANAQGHVYEDERLAPAPLPGGSLPIKRGWVQVDVKHQGAWFRFVSTHPEAYSPEYRTAQIQELAQRLGDVTGRLVVVGDMNSRPDGSDGGSGYQLLLGACLVDVWPVVHPGELGYTSGWNADLTLTADPVTGEPLALYERIDLVLFRGAVSAQGAYVVGEELSDRVGGLWPSDHAGVVATLRLEDPRFFTPPACQ